MTTDTPGVALIWARVSTTDQHAENQLAVLRGWAADLGAEVAAEYITEDSAWATNGGKGAEFDRKRKALLSDVQARRGTPVLVLVWAIDRLSRQGTEDMMAFLRRLAEAGADVRSKQDPWLNTVDPFAREILLGVFATVAKYESQRRSERIKAGLARRRAEGKPVGRQPGAIDKKQRRRAGYVATWEDGGTRREQQRKAPG